MPSGDASHDLLLMQAKYSVKYEHSRDTEHLKFEMQQAVVHAYLVQQNHMCGQPSSFRQIRIVLLSVLRWCEGSTHSAFALGGEAGMVPWIIFFCNTSPQSIDARPNQEGPAHHTRNTNVPLGLGSAGRPGWSGSGFEGSGQLQKLSKRKYRGGYTCGTPVCRLAPGALGWGGCQDGALDLVAGNSLGNARRSSDSPIFGSLLCTMATPEEQTPTSPDDTVNEAGVGEVTFAELDSLGLETPAEGKQITLEIMYKVMTYWPKSKQVL